MTRAFTLVRGLSLLALLIGGALIAHRALAEGTAVTQERQTAIEQTRAKTTDIERAKMSGLNLEEWQRYTTVMSGPRGLWSPALDPIWVLGIHARSDDERRRYADLAAQQEHARVEGELAFNREYVAAFARLYPAEKLIDDARYDLLRRNKGREMKTSRPARTTEADRILFFVPLKEDCTRCEAVLPKLIARASSGTGIDIYFAGSDATDNKAIQKWAVQRGIPPNLVQSGLITLNYDQLVLARLRKEGRTLPQLMVRRGSDVLDTTQEQLGL
jgi:integrating conjugative element protein (TIGR03759 family)